MQPRILTLKAASYETREEVFEGRKHLVVPVIALVEGVIHAMNAPNPELVTAAEYTRAGVVGGFNGRPLYRDHPVVNGEPVSGNSPELLETLSIGRVFNSTVKAGKLAMEAWIDIDRATEVAPDILERAQAGEPIEISVGVYCETDDSEKGSYDGKKYAGAWHDIVPDHLALLPAEVQGACSNEMGCGVRAAKGEAVSEDKKERKASLFSRLMSAMRGAQSPAEMSDNDVRRSLSEELRKKDPRALYPEAVYADAAEPYLVYCVYEGSDMMYFRRNYTMSADGAVSFGDPVEVEPVLSYEDVSPVVAVASPKNAAEGAPCSCKNQNKDTRSASDMKKEDLVTKLDTATPEQLEALGKVFDAPAAAPAVVVEQPAVAAAAKPVKFEDVLAAASNTGAESNGISAHGTIIKRNGTAIAELKDITPPPLTRKPIDTTTHNSDDDSYVVGIRRKGELQFMVNFLPSGEATHDATTGCSMRGPRARKTVRHLCSRTARCGCSQGFVTNIAPKQPVDGVQEASISIRPSGGQILTP
jgi:cell pole-organizing protein PopZ